MKTNNETNHARAEAAPVGSTCLVDADEDLHVAYLMGYHKRDSEIRKLKKAVERLTRRKKTMENTQDENAEAVRSSAWLGALPDGDGWYAVYCPPQQHEAIVRVRYDGERGERVVDVVGQPLKQSEELWRYKEWVWSERLPLTAPNAKGHGSLPTASESNTKKP